MLTLYVPVASPSPIKAPPPSFIVHQLCVGGVISLITVIFDAVDWIICADATEVTPKRKIKAKITFFVYTVRI